MLLYAVKSEQQRYNKGAVFISKDLCRAHRCTLRIAKKRKIRMYVTVYKRTR